MASVCWPMAVRHEYPFRNKAHRRSQIGRDWIRELGKCQVRVPCLVRLMRHILDDTEVIFVDLYDKRRNR